MRNLLLIISLIGLMACNSHKPHPEYAEISGKIMNATTNEIVIYGKGNKKTITLNDDGTFKDTIKITENARHALIIRGEVPTRLYMENGADIYFEVDKKNYKRTLKFQKDFKDYNNYIVGRINIVNSDKDLSKKLLKLDQASFDSKIDMFKKEIEHLYATYPNIPAKQFEYEKSSNDSYINGYVSEYKTIQTLGKGKPSPTFENYENFDGSKTSLSNFKGKYVYIDVWATWCRPCKAEIPALQELEKEYHGKNIAFVSLSIDKKKDYDKWRTMVKDLNLSGVQLIAPNDSQSEFIKEYNIGGIPRFILIDPNGNIVNYNAPRPSDKEKIKSLFSSIDKLN